MDEIVAVTVPDVAQEAARDLVRAREDVRGDLMRARHRLSKLLLRHGHRLRRRERLDRRARRMAAAHARSTCARPGTPAGVRRRLRGRVLTRARRDRLDAAIAAMAADSEFTPTIRGWAACAGSPR